MTKRVLSLLLAVLTVFSLCAPAFADGESTLTEEPVETEEPAAAEVPAATEGSFVPSVAITTTAIPGTDTLLVKPGVGTPKGWKILREGWVYSSHKNWWEDQADWVYSVDEETYPVKYKYLESYDTYDYVVVLQCLEGTIKEKRYLPKGETSDRYDSEKDLYFYYEYTDATVNGMKCETKIESWDNDILAVRTIDPITPKNLSKSDYQMVTGMNGKWKQNREKTLTFGGNGHRYDFSSLKVDGKVVPEKNDDGDANYETGSDYLGQSWVNYEGAPALVKCTVELQEAYLSTLMPGKHKLEMVFQDGGVCSAQFEVEKPSYTLSFRSEGTTTWSPGGGLYLEADGPYHKFTGVEVDGKALKASQYEAKGGTPDHLKYREMYVDLKSDYLNNLGYGKHTVTVLFQDGKCSTQFEIEKLAAPKITNVEPSSSGVFLEWEGDKELSDYYAYRVFYKGDGKTSWTKLGDSNFEMFHWDEAKPGTKYSFTVRSVTPDGKQYMSDYDKTGKSVTTPGESVTYYAAPTVKIAQTSGGIQVTWNAVSGSPRYMVYYKENGGGWKKIGTTAKTSYTRAAKYLKAGATYQFTVRCCAGDKKTLLSAYKASNSLKYTAELAAPTVKIAQTSGGIQVTWNAVSGSSRYMVYYKENGGGWKKIGTTSKTSYLRKASALKNGATYQFTVRCCASDKKTLLSPYKASNSVKYTVQLAAPAVKIAQVSGGIQVTWNAVSGSPLYMVYYKENGGGWQKIGTTAKTSYTRAASKLKNGATYQFTVRCCASDKKTLLSPYKASNSLKYRK